MQLIEDAFYARKIRSMKLGREIEARLDALPGRDAAEAVRWLYAASPLSDWANYPFQMFLDCGEHGVFLRRQNPGLPDGLFLHYVLPLRVNEEELSGCRKFFHDMLAPRLRGLSPVDAVLEVNRWCAEQVTYRSTDDRTRSALAVWRSGSGRCGEESVFAVNALRSVGIPARQIYTPRWAHCDDNHAWVEVWADGAWHFLGACEPEAVLDRGWFTNAAGRAMVIHSRRFGPSDGGEEVICQSGAATYLNQLPRYADTRTLTVRVTDPKGLPAEGAEVCFGILNMAEIYPAASVKTAADGKAQLTCGRGSCCIQARKDGIVCERLASPEEDEVEITLTPESPALDTWEEFIFTAPLDRSSPAPQPAEELKALGRAWTAEAAQKRSQRNIQLPAYTPEEEAVLAVLSEKDRLDADPEVLREALEVSREYEASCGELYWQYVVCPRVADEPLRPCRKFILEYFPEKQKESFRKFPQEIQNFIRESVAFAPELEYDRLVTLPAEALTLRHGSPLSQKILFVTICRTLGVPARLNPVDGEVEFWNGREFQAVDAPPADCSVTLDCPEEWRSGSDFSAAALKDGLWQTLRLTGRTFLARPGDYRVLTSNRLPNGDQFVSRYHFRMSPGESKTIRLQKYRAEPSRMLGSYALEEFTVFSQDGRPVPGSSFGKAVFFWLEEGAEPTEHILNELLERREAFVGLPLVFLIRSPAALENPKLREVLPAVPAQVYFDSFVPNVETIARRVYVDHEKLPLIVVTEKPLNAVYASSGYNVGSGDMILRICGLL